MIQQLLIFMAEIPLRFIFTREVPVEAWEVLGRLYSGISSMVQWTPRFPYMPYTHFYLAVQVSIMAYIAALVWGAFFTGVKLVSAGAMKG